MKKHLTLVVLAAFWLCQVVLPVSVLAGEKKFGFSVAGLTIRTDWSGKTAVDGNIGPVYSGALREQYLSFTGSSVKVRGASMASVKTTPVGPAPSDLQSFFADLAADKLLLKASDYRLAFEVRGYHFGSTEEMVAHLLTLEVRTIQVPMVAVMGRAIPSADMGSGNGQIEWTLDINYSRPLEIGERVLYDPAKGPVLSLKCRNVIISVDDRPVPVANITVTAPSSVQRVEAPPGATALAPESRPQTAREALVGGLLTPPAVKQKKEKDDDSHTGLYIAIGVGVVVVAGVAHWLLSRDNDECRNDDCETPPSNPPAENPPRENPPRENPPRENPPTDTHPPEPPARVLSSLTLESLNY